MSVLWILTAFIWGASITLTLTCWYFRRTFLRLAERIATLEADEARAIVVVGTEQEILRKIAAVLEIDEHESATKH